MTAPAQDNYADALPTWDEKKKGIIQVCGGLNTTYDRLLGLANKVKAGTWQPSTLADMERLLGFATPLTDDERILALVIEVLASFGRGPMIEYLFKIRRACLMLLVDGRLAATALGIENLVEIWIDENDAYHVELLREEDKLRVKDARRARASEEAPLALDSSKRPARAEQPDRDRSGESTPPDQRRRRSRGGRRVREKKERAARASKNETDRPDRSDRSDRPRGEHTSKKPVMGLAECYDILGALDSAAENAEEALGTPDADDVFPEAQQLLHEASAKTEPPASTADKKASTGPTYLEIMTRSAATTRSRRHEPEQRRTKKDLPTPPATGVSTTARPSGAPATALPKKGAATRERESIRERSPRDRDFGEEPSRATATATATATEHLPRKSTSLPALPPLRTLSTEAIGGETADDSASQASASGHASGSTSVTSLTPSVSTSLESLDSVASLALLTSVSPSISSASPVSISVTASPLKADEAAPRKKAPEAPLPEQTAATAATAEETTLMRSWADQVDELEEEDQRRASPRSATRPTKPTTTMEQRIAAARAEDLARERAKDRRERGSRPRESSDGRRRESGRDEGRDRRK